MAKRVALVGDDGGSLAKFCLSWLQSLLLVNTEKRLPSHIDQDIDIDSLGPEDLVVRARLVTLVLSDS